MTVLVHTEWKRGPYIVSEKIGHQMVEIHRKTPIWYGGIGVRTHYIFATTRESYDFGGGKATPTNNNEVWTNWQVTAFGMQAS